MRRNWLEWVALAVAVAAVLMVVAVLLIDGLGGTSRPPALSVELHRDRAYDSEHGWMLPATMTNEGDEAAEAVRLEALATVGGSEERSAVDVDYAPSGSDVELTFGFSAEPDGEVTVRVLAFRLP